MKKLYEPLGNVVGIFGVLLCVLGGLCRATSEFYVFGIEAMTVFVVGVGMMVFACLVKVHLLGLKS